MEGICLEGQSLYSNASAPSQRVVAKKEIRKECIGCAALHWIAFEPACVSRQRQQLPKRALRQQHCQFDTDSVTFGGSMQVGQPNEGPKGLDEEETQLNLCCTVHDPKEGEGQDARLIRHLQETDNLAVCAKEGRRIPALLCQERSERQHPQSSDHRTEQGNSREALEPSLQTLDSPLPASDATPADLEPSELALHTEQFIAASADLREAGCVAAETGLPADAEAGPLDSSKIHKLGQPVNYANSKPGEQHDSWTGQEKGRSNRIDQLAEQIAIPPSACIGDAGTPLRPAFADLGKLSFTIHFALMQC